MATEGLDMFGRSSGGSLLLGEDVRRKIVVAAPAGIGELRNDASFRKLGASEHDGVTIHVLFPGAKAADNYYCGDSDVIDAALIGKVTPQKLVIVAQGGSEFDFSDKAYVCITHPKVMLEVSGGRNSDWFTPGDVVVRADGRFTAISLNR